MLALAYCGVFEMLSMRPFGIHVIRQTDCLSIVSDYFHHHSSFFEPAMYNLGYSEGKGLSEFPILYFVTAKIYSFVGEKEWVLRIIHLMIFVFGFAALTRLIIRVLQDKVYAVLLSLLFSSSTVLLFYAANFLPEIPALGFTLMGWERYVKFKQEEKRSTFIWACFFMSIAALLKISFLIHFGTLALIEFFRWWGNTQWRTEKKRLYMFMLPLLGIAIAFTWWMYAIQFNRSYDQTYYLLKLMPIWKLSGDQIVGIWDYITRYWWGNLYYYSTFHLFFLIVIVWLIRPKKWNGYISNMAIVSAIGALFYFFLFYAQFKDHDYYFIVMMPALFLLVIDGIRQLTSSVSNRMGQYSIKLIILVVCVLSINYAKLGMSRRLISDNQEISKELNQLDGIRGWLENKNVPADARFIVLGDQTHNGSLYFMNRKGWQIKKGDEAGNKLMRKALKDGASFVLLYQTDMSDFLKETIPSWSSLGHYNGKEIMKINRPNK